MIDTILENVVKMLTERKLLAPDKFNENYNKLLKQKNDERIFKIKSNFSEEEIHIMLINGKISSIKKIQGIDAFLVNANKNKKIFIGNGISQKAFKQFIDIDNSEVFFEYEFLMNIIDHELQPKFELLNNEEKEIKLREYDLTLSNIPRMLKTDAIARYYNAKPGDIFRIIRPSAYSGLGFSYRQVVESSIQNIYN